MGRADLPVVAQSSSTPTWVPKRPMPKGFVSGIAVVVPTDEHGDATACDVEPRPLFPDKPGAPPGEGTLSGALGTGRGGDLLLRKPPPPVEAYGRRGSPGGARSEGWRWVRH
ncbi:hypothetical protein MLD38_018926 [Melastoma candidum]|uniref:Uncharacterized protein n=1 Tax=Melastoma candidum TaxID=119954 RepID=A0ACB9QX80_9MYRT|nr:hypothetical protein MLD38_018926 [Melastoma candidum]